MIDPNSSPFKRRVAEDAISGINVRLTVVRGKAGRENRNHVTLTLRRRPTRIPPASARILLEMFAKKNEEPEGQT